MSEDYVDRLVDEGALRAYLEEHLGPVERFHVERHAEGHSNETLFVTHGDRELVLRRPPAGETAETAHDVLREYTVVDALQDTAVPVPPTVLACEDDSVVGSDFYVMDRLDGVVLREAEPERFADPDARRALSEDLVDTLAAIHATEPADVGLSEFGHPEGFTERQVRRWSEQFTWAFETTADEREVPAVYEVMEWLTDNAPEQHPHTLVHGDYKLDNVMYAPDRPELVGVFDWEMATLGDPLADLGWLLSYWRDAGDPEPAAPRFARRFTEREGYPDRERLVARWESATDIEARDLRFYRVLAVYKLAALGEMFFKRYLQGNSADPLYPAMEETVPALAERALEIAHGERPL